MPPDSPSPGQVADWLKRAESNLLRAKQEKPDGVLYEDLCFDAQQCSEKSLKALLLYRGVSFRYVHDIAELLTNLIDAGIEVPEKIRKAAILTEYAVAARYPSFAEPVTKEEYDEALELATSVFDWVSKKIPDKGNQRS